MPKRPIGDRALTNTERSQAWRARRQAELDQLRAEVERLKQPLTEIQFKPLPRHRNVV